MACRVFRRGAGAAVQPISSHWTLVLLRLVHSARIIRLIYGFDLLYGLGIGLTPMGDGKYSGVPWVLVYARASELT